MKLWLYALGATIVAVLPHNRACSEVHIEVTDLADIIETQCAATGVVSRKLGHLIRNYHDLTQ